MRKIRKLIVHCSATPEGKHYSVDTIRKWHLKRGWRDIGYHFVIDLEGNVEEGRPIEITGAHTKGENFDSIGICYIGGVEKDRDENGEWVAKDTRTPEQKEALEDLLCRLKGLYSKAVVYGHNDFSSKACPCFNAKQEYAWISNQF
jgi:N-acetylmuramoyl-L-alanine amidase